MECGYCFHSNPAQRISAPSPLSSGQQTFRPQTDLPHAIRGLKLLHNAGCTKLNIAGGEPFLFKEFTLALTRAAKDVGIAYTSVISNGEHAIADDSIDMLGISIDSFVPETNSKIGRTATLPLSRLLQLKAQSRVFKINTVVSAHNVHEDFNKPIEAIDPDRWKLFQVLSVPGENDGHGTEVSPEAFDAFVSRHPRGIPEPNDVMQSSYLILDEYMRFLDGTTKVPMTPPIYLDSAAITFALSQWDVAKFKARKGDFYLND